MEKEKGKKIPVLDRGECTDCESCLNLAPSIFRRNEETGCIEVVDIAEYQEEVVHEVIRMCPRDCITWDEA